ncbi:hypothetical protein BJV82DRAFT_642958 [Fennellomyces sp. T-0311]|nr:hypothetical protein BJV82DRAFT_642958 [Fennellomyces sp. T-0311]
MSMRVGSASEIPAFLGLTQQQSALLVALYNETDPDFAKQIPTALPVAAQQLAAEYEKRNSIGKKLERAEAKYLDEYKEFEKVQQEAVERLSKSDMNIDKAAEGLDLKGSNRHDLLLGSFLYGGVRREAAGPEDRAAMSPVASPNFEGAKKLMEAAFDGGCTMAAVQIGSFYMQEDRLAGGKNMKDGEDCKKLAFEYYKKAADQGNPMACHKIAFFSENGYGCTESLERAIEYYTKAYDQGYPDSAHNLGLIYQGHTKATMPLKSIKKAMDYLERGKQWGYAPSANALGRLYLLMSKNADFAKEAQLGIEDNDEYIVTGIDFMDFMELAMVRGDKEAYTYLVRILRAKMAARVALEEDNLEKFEKLSLQDQAKLIRQVAKEAAPEAVRHKQCSSTFCTNTEQKEGDFKKCGRCQRVSYCSRECQKEHWKAGHKAVCNAPSSPSQS